MIFDRLAFWRTMFPGRTKAEARLAVDDTVPRWREAATRTPELTEDLIRLGGVLTLQARDSGIVDINDPLRLAYEAGRRDLALELLSMMALTPRTLTILMEDNERS